MGSDRADRVVAAINDLAQAEGTQVSVRHVCQACATMVHAGGVALYVIGDLGLGEPVHATDPVSERVAELQVTLGEGPADIDTASGKHLEHKTRLRHWVEPLKLPSSRVSLHVVAAANATGTLLDLARANHVDLIVLGAPGPTQRALAWWRSVASSVTANAPCSVYVVRVPERASEPPPD